MATSPWFVLLASLSGIVVGWAFTEFSVRARSKRERRETKEHFDSERVFGVLRAWQIVLDNSAMLAMQKDHASRGSTEGQGQVVEQANALNVAQARLRELEFEVEVLGPDWIRPKVREIAQKLSGLNKDLAELDKPAFSTEKGLAFRDRVDEMLRDRQSLIELARRNLDGS